MAIGIVGGGGPMGCGQALFVLITVAIAIAVAIAVAWWGLWSAMQP